MKKILIFIIALLAVGISTAEARDTPYFLPIKDAMAVETKTPIDKSIKLYFSNQAHPPVVTTWGTVVSNRKTSSIGKSDIFACNWTFMSALLQLQKTARQYGANSVINIVSYYDRRPHSSTKDFECHAGATIAGVVLKGEIVKLANK